MGKVPKLDDDDVRARLAKLPSWTLVAGKLHREIRFPSFVEAFAFMAKVAVLAEKRNHHPEWSNDYASVVIDLVTHDAGGITALDFELAAEIDSILAPAAP